jgi:exo-beta-1,3-glucanase (GH17 family)
MNFYKIHGYCLGTHNIPEETYRRYLKILHRRAKWIRGYAIGEYPAHRTAKDMGYKVAVGAWLGQGLEENEKQLSLLIAEAKAGYVDMAIVGSETLFRKDLNDAELATYIGRFKNAVPNVPVAVCDVADALYESPLVLDACDLVGANIYPYWDGIRIENSMAWLEKKFRKLEKLTGKEIFISETGWPTAGNIVGKAVANPENALRYFKEFVEWTTRWSVRYFYFAAFDESWKKIFEHEQGAHWGRYTEDGTEKPWVNWQKNK